MTAKKRGPNDKPLFIDMDADEALRRFIGVDPKELPKGIMLGKQLKKKAAKPKSRSRGVETKSIGKGSTDGSN